MVFKKIPKNFNSKFEIVSCFCELDGKILLLHRQDHKPQGDTWGVPAGKRDNDETLFQAIIREIREETGIELSCQEVEYYKKVFVRYANYDFIYHIFHVELKTPIKVILNKNEHKNFQWLTPQQALEINLIEDLEVCIEIFYDS